MAGSELSTTMTSMSYTCFISSNDKISGDNNNGTYQINWEDFLPRDYTSYKCSFSFQTGGGNYLDTNFTATGSITGTTLTLTLISGSINVVPGMNISNSTGTVKANTTILSQLTGTAGSTGTYQLSNSQTIASTSLVIGIVYTGCKIVFNSIGRSFSFDAATKSESYTLGYAQRDIQTSTSSSNSFSTFYLQFPPKTMNRPNQNLMNISIYNINGNALLTDNSTTKIPLNDMTSWQLILEFTPIWNSKIVKGY